MPGNAGVGSRAAIGVNYVNVYEINDGYTIKIEEEKIENGYPYFECHDYEEAVRLVKLF